MGLEVYSTLCLPRADQAYSYANPDKRPETFLMSERTLAIADTLEIDPMADTFPDKFEPVVDEVHRYWQVFDRTAGIEVEHAAWDYDTSTGMVTVRNAMPFHEYTVNFLARQTWDSTSMYNHITNSWTCPKIISVDGYDQDVHKQFHAYFDQWLAEHPDTDVVRFTTFFAHFTIQNNRAGTQKYVDWTGYTEAITTQMLDDFEKEYGYRLTAEDLVDAGSFANTNLPPTRKLLDVIAFTHKWVKGLAAEFTAKAHAAGKTTAMFQGDHWTGTEPYADDFGDMGIDISIGACKDGISLRRVADSGGDKMKEIRLYPYLFPNEFTEEADPIGSACRFWRETRRAMLRRPIDRMGYGGYLSLAVQFPEFINAVAGFCDEFRGLKHHSQMTKPYAHPVKVAVLSAWGKLRSWHTTSDVASCGGGVAASNLLECLSGLPVEVRFIDFDDIRNGELDNIDVVVNDGDAGSAWSGGVHWKDPAVVAAVRRFVHEGGGFIGSRQPSAVDHQGRFFQLADVLGVDEEIGRTLTVVKPEGTAGEGHFILDAGPAFDAGMEIGTVYPVGAETRVLQRAKQGTHILLATNRYGEGRSAYFSRMPFTMDNARMLLKAILWSAGKEELLKVWSSSHPNVDVAAYPEAGAFTVVNSSDEPIKTTVFDGNGDSFDVELGADEMKWFAL